MDSNSIVLLVGKRGTGKSTLVSDICYHMRNKLDVGIAMSPTEECTDSLSQYVPGSWIYPDYSEHRLRTLLEVQRGQWKRGHGHQAYVIMDDCM